MKNYLKITTVVAMLCLISCDKEDDTAKTKQEDLFNLKVGRNWVYKNYDGDSLQNMRFSNSLDSVVLTDKFTFENKNYFKRETFYKNLNMDEWGLKEVRYVHVNSKGYLIMVEQDPREKSNQKENILHPGMNKDFTYEEEFFAGGESYGIVVCKSENNQTINVEGKDYVSYPYIWRLKPNEKVKKELIAEFHYAKNVGLVKEITPVISGSFIIEKRLISYKD